MVANAKETAHRGHAHHHTTGSFSGPSDQIYIFKIVITLKWRVCSMRLVMENEEVELSRGRPYVI